MKHQYAIAFGAGATAVVAGIISTQAGLILAFGIIGVAVILILVGLGQLALPQKK